MNSQLLLFAEGAALPDGPAARAAWALDDETREIGLRRVAEARAILRARRRSAGPPAESEQPAA